MDYNLDPINKFIYIVDENGDFHTPENTNLPAVYYLETKIAIYMNHGTIKSIHNTANGNSINTIINILKKYKLKNKSKLDILKNYNTKHKSKLDIVIDTKYQTKLNIIPNPGTVTTDDALINDIEQNDIENSLTKIPRSIETIAEFTYIDCKNKDNIYHICSSYCAKKIEMENKHK
jgi:hypothetical protein